MFQEATLKFNPAVPRPYLLAVSALLWMIAGTVLCLRAFVWMEVLSPPLEVIILVSCLLAGITGYVIGFSKVVQRNINRINLLPARVCVFAFAAWKGYLMIAVMIVLGLTLRNTPIPKTYLSVPYAIMGSVLLIGSVGFFREFFNGLTRKNRMET